MRITLNSTNPDKFNKIFVGIPAVPSSHYAKLTVVRLNCNCHFLVLEKSDYLELKISGMITKIYFDDFTIMEPEVFVELLNLKFTEYNIQDVTAMLDSCRRVIFNSQSDFEITDASYNMKLISGMFWINSYPISSEFKSLEFSISMKCVGFSLLTPKLYLLSNLGSTCLRQESNSNNIQSCGIAMEIDNSFTPQMPIISGNMEISMTCSSNSISAAEFTLVDSNLHEVKLLTPMYLTIIIEPVSSLI